MSPLIFNTLDQTLIFLPLAISIYFSYSVMRVTDLTVEGTLVHSAACYAILMLNNVSELVAIIVAILMGGLIGVIVSILQNDKKINDLLASILMLFILYSVNFIVMSKPNISLLEINGFNNNYLKFAVLGLSLMLIIYIQNSRTGLKFKAFAQNPKLFSHLGYSIPVFRTLGLAISNAIAGLSGIILAKEGGFVDINMGMGMALTGIGTVVIGTSIMKALFKRHSGNFEILGVVLGVLMYFTFVNLLLTYEIDTIYLKLIIGLIIISIFKTISFREV